MMCVSSPAIESPRGQTGRKPARIRLQDGLEYMLWTGPEAGPGDPVLVSVHGISRNALAHVEWLTRLDLPRLTIVAPHFDVVKQVLAVERTNRLADTDAINRVTDVNRQVVEYRALGNTLQALDANVLDDEVLRGHRSERRQDEQRDQCVSDVQCISVRPGQPRILAMSL